MKNLLALAALVLIAHASAATVITVNFSAAFDNGFALQNGTALPVGNEVRLGSFDISDAQVTSLMNAGQLQSLATHFTLFSNAFIGTDAFAANLGQLPLNQRSGLFEKSSQGTLSPASANKNIYMWVFKTTADNGVAADFSNVLQAGIFGNVASSWVFPADSGDPDTRTLDITNLTDASGNNLTGNQNILFGAFGTGTTPATNKPAFNLLGRRARNVQDEFVRHVGDGTGCDQRR